LRALSSRDSTVAIRDRLARLTFEWCVSCACRYSVAETVQLLSEIGLRDGGHFESNGITGGDLLDLEEEELKEDLHLSNLQVRVPLKCKKTTAILECDTHEFRGRFHQIKFVLKCCIGVAQTLYPVKPYCSRSHPCCGSQSRF